MSSDDRPLRVIALDRIVERTKRVRHRVAVTVCPELDATANELHWHFTRMLEATHEKRYTDDGGCPGCYDACLEYEALIGYDEPSET